MADIYLGGAKSDPMHTYIVFSVFIVCLTV